MTKTLATSAKSASLCPLASSGETPPPLSVVTSPQYLPSRVDHLVTDRCPEQVKQMREHNHQPRQDEENHRGIRDLVPYRFDAVEQLLHKCLRRRGLDDGDDRSLLTHAPASISSSG